MYASFRSASASVALMVCHQRTRETEHSMMKQRYGDERPISQSSLHRHVFAALDPRD